jgi:hypothetical protein
VSLSSSTKGSTAARTAVKLNAGVADSVSDSSSLSASRSVGTACKGDASVRWAELDMSASVGESSFERETKQWAGRKIQKI